MVAEFSKVWCYYSNTKSIAQLVKIVWEIDEKV